MLNVEVAARSALLRAAESRSVEELVRRHGMRLGASRFVSGESLEDELCILRELNERGFRANATVLGEAVTTAEDATRAIQDYERLISEIAHAQLRANIAVKLSLLGLDIDIGLARENLQGLLAIAEGHGIFVRIDMEGGRYVEPTIETYRQMREDGHDSIGMVLQAYLYRTGRDLEDLLYLKPNLRIVKGAYRESPSIAFPRKTEVDANYVKLMERALREGGYTAIATHDDRIIEHAISFTHRNSIPRDRFEFQMLYGIRPQLQTTLVRRGFRVLIATCYGTHWYPFFMRRLAERPANTLFLLKNLIRA